MAYATALVHHEEVTRAHALVGLTIGLLLASQATACFLDRNGQQIFGEGQGGAANVSTVGSGEGAVKGATGGGGVMTNGSSSSGPAQAGAGGGGGMDDPGAGAGGGGGVGGSMTVDPCVVSSIPDTVPILCSENADSKVSLTISNVCVSEAIEVFWVNSNCDEVSYGSYAPGDSFVVQSYKSHPWRVRNATTQVLLADIPPLMSDTMIAFP
jgi:hypothetical protein